MNSGRSIMVLRQRIQGITARTYSSRSPRAFTAMSVSIRKRP